jgi:hypothetical protein
MWEMFYTSIYMRIGGVSRMLLKVIGRWIDGMTSFNVRLKREELMRKNVEAIIDKYREIFDALAKS